MADYIQATPRNEVLGTIADLLRKGKEKGGFVGDLLLGDSDKFVDDLSYGQGPLKGAGGIGGTTGLKNTGMVDAAMLPGAATLATLLRKAPQAAAKAAETVPDLSRRAFTGGGAAAAALGAVSPAMLVKALKAAPGKIAPEAAAAVAKAVSSIGPEGIALLAKRGLSDGRFTFAHPDPEAFHSSIKAVADAYPKADQAMLDRVLNSHNYSGGGKPDLTPEQLKMMQDAGGELQYIEKVLNGEVPRPSDEALSDLASGPLVYDIGDVEKYPKAIREWMESINKAYE